MCGFLYETAGIPPPNSSNFLLVILRYSYTLALEHQKCVAKVSVKKVI